MLHEKLHWTPRIECTQSRTGRKTRELRGGNQATRKGREGRIPQEDWKNPTEMYANMGWIHCGYYEEWGHTTARNADRNGWNKGNTLRGYHKQAKKEGRSQDITMSVDIIVEQPQLLALLTKFS